LHTIKFLVILEYLFYKKTKKEHAWGQEKGTT